MSEIVEHNSRVQSSVSPASVSLDFTRRTVSSYRALTCTERRYATFAPEVFRDCFSLYLPSNALTSFG
jgi:hypothetical protein